jgi:hypothetical protein
MTSRQRVGPTTTAHLGLRVDGGHAGAARPHVAVGDAVPVQRARLPRLPGRRRAGARPPRGGEQDDDGTTPASSSFWRPWSWRRPARRGGRAKLKRQVFSRLWAWALVWIARPGVASRRFVCGLGFSFSAPRVSLPSTAGPPCDV